jgi:hypothetical protein
MIPGAFHLAILRGAAILVPEWRRPDWLAEWRSELWHVRREPHGLNITAFCLGAFRDAFWLLRDGPIPRSQSLLHLNVAAPPDNIESFPDPGLPALSSPLHCLSWLAALLACAAAIAFLLPASREAALGALSSRNLVILTPDRGYPTIFDPSPAVARTEFEALRTRSGAQFSALTFNDGVVTGRLRYETLRDSKFHFIRLRDRSRELFLGAIPMVLFACVLVPLLMSGASGSDLPTRPHRVLFLFAKTLLVLPIVALSSLDLASLGRTVSPLYFDLVFFGSMFAVRWIVYDQRERCPVCLRLLANPVRIGGASRILLEWHGTELMCLRGHGLLYVPEWPAIWSGRQRWMELGTSWGGLFP